MRTGIVLMSRIPQPGVSKTRLEPGFTAEQCAGFHRACLTDELRALNGLPGVKYFYYTGELLSEYEETSPQMETICGLEKDILREWIIVKQQGPDLGQRMLYAAGIVLADLEAVIIVGSDLPWLTAERILEAADQLQYHDVVLGPTVDGGYYLIGIKKAAECLFEGILWGTDQVLKATKAVVAFNNMSCCLLARERDIDTPADLSWFWSQGQEEPRLQDLASYQYLSKTGQRRM